MNDLRVSCSVAKMANVFAVLMVILGSLGVAPVQADDPQVWFKGNTDSLVKLYLYFHKNPELSFQEKETGDRFAKELEEIGCEVTKNVGGYGVVGILKNGDGPTVMVRADFDALPITELTGQSYASTKKVKNENGVMVGVMHACGHDVHMTSLIGTARYLADNKDRWAGTVMFIGQPAEERGAGAKAMLAEGLFTKWKKPDFALALHVNSTLPSGKIAFRAGYAMANVDSVDIEVFGRGGHGAYPHATVDPIVLSAKLILDLQTIVSREVKPIEPAVVTVGSIHGGTKHNIIPDSVHLQLTVRSYSDEVRAQVLAAIKRKAKANADSVGAKEPEVVVSEGTPSLSNDQKLADRLRTVFKAALGDDNVRDTEPVMGGEDFSQYGRAGVPSLMFHLGAVEDSRLKRYREMKITPPSLHTATFYPDIEKTLATGVTAMSTAVLDLMKKSKKNLPQK